jgi:hypothetical protein
MEIRKRFLGDIVANILILVLIALFVIGTLLIFKVPTRTRGSVYNEGATGVSLFAGWLNGRGYQVGTLDSENERVASGDAVLFILAPRSGFARNDLWWLDGWVQRGGTLVIAQESRQPSDLTGQFGVGIGRLLRPVSESSLRLPTLNWPFVGQAKIEARHYVSNACGEFPVHMGSCPRPLLVGIGRGLGRVFVLSSAHPFTNEGIEDAGNAQLVENIVLAVSTPGQRVVFDEIHHQISLTWLFTTATGIAFWLALMALIAFLIWQNSYAPTTRVKRQKKLALPVAATSNNLQGAQRQFARPEAIKQHYWQRLKRVLSRRYGVDPLQIDADFIESLKPIMAEEDLGTIVYLLSNKEKFPPMTDYELRQWVSVIVDLSDSHVLTREIYEYQKIL